MSDDDSLWYQEITIRVIIEKYDIQPRDVLWDIDEALREQSYYVACGVTAHRDLTDEQCADALRAMREETP